MDITKAMRIFVEVVDTGNFAAAADKLDASGAQISPRATISS